MSSLWRGMVHVGGLITGDSQTLLITCTPLATSQAFNGVRTSKGIATKRGTGESRNNEAYIKKKTFVYDSILIFSNIDFTFILFP